MRNVLADVRAQKRRNGVLSKHKRWLASLQETRAMVQAAQEEDAARQEEARARFLAAQARRRAEIRGVATADVGDDRQFERDHPLPPVAMAPPPSASRAVVAERVSALPPVAPVLPLHSEDGEIAAHAPSYAVAASEAMKRNGAHDTAGGQKKQKTKEKRKKEGKKKKKKEKSKATPAWAQTPAMAEAAEEAEVEDLLSFAETLDFEEYVREQRARGLVARSLCFCVSLSLARFYLQVADLEVRTALETIKDRIDHLAEEGLLDSSTSSDDDDNDDDDDDNGNAGEHRVAGGRGVGDSGGGGGGGGGGDAPATARPLPPIATRFPASESEDALHQVCWVCCNFCDFFIFFGGGGVVYLLKHCIYVAADRSPVCVCNYAVVSSGRLAGTARRWMDRPGRWWRCATRSP